MSIIALVGFDPSLRNWGIARANYHVDEDRLEIERVDLHSTSKTTNKRMRANSDDLACARNIRKSMVEECHGAKFAVVEVPSGTQSARGAMSNGICLGILASCPIPIIEVNPIEVKLAAVGDKKASKGQMIEWAVKAYPNAGWRYRKWKGQMELLAENEHMADAVAAIHAGVISQQFKELVAIGRAFL